MTARHRHPANIVRHDERSFADRVADWLAEFLGSWRFVIGQAVFLGGWFLVNTYCRGIAWDPPPFLMANILMSAEAAFATPVILMSQNRQAEHDRIRAEEDYAHNAEALDLLRKIADRMHVDGGV